MNLLKKDQLNLHINYTEEDIKTFSKWQWKQLVKRNVKMAAFEYLLKENSTKEKTKSIKFDTFSMSPYLFENRSTSLSKIIFSVRSGTLDIKEWNIWNYTDNIYVLCDIYVENIDHFMTCEAYEEETRVTNWKLILENDSEMQYKIAAKIENRLKMRENKMYEDGLASDSLAPLLQHTVLSSNVDILFT